MIEWYLFLTFSHLRSSIITQADPNSCRKQVECFICDSRHDPACEDPRTFPHRNITIRLCDDYCLKIWTRENESIAGDDKTHASRYVQRDCHKVVRYHIKKAETCYRHKKHASDSFCLCASDRCNSTTKDIRSNGMIVIAVCVCVFFSMFYCLDVL